MTDQTVSEQSYSWTDSDGDYGQLSTKGIEYDATMRAIAVLQVKEIGGLDSEVFLTPEDAMALIMRLETLLAGGSR